MAHMKSFLVAVVVVKLKPSLNLKKKSLASVQPEVEHAPDGLCISAGPSFPAYSSLALMVVNF